MKKALFILVAMVSVQTWASADQLVETIRCVRAQSVPDLGLGVSLFEGGFAGIPQLQVSRFYLGHTQKDTFLVHQTSSASGPVGAPMEWAGEDITFSVNFTTSPDAKGGHHGVLTEKNADGSQTEEDLSCRKLSAKTRGR